MKKLFLISFFLLVSSAPVWAEERVSFKGVPESPVIQAKDWLQVTITPEDAYIKGGRMQVSAEGDLNFDLIGKVSVAGKTVEEIEKSLTRKIDADYLVHPTVKIEILNKNPATQAAKV